MMTAPTAPAAKAAKLPWWRELRSKEDWWAIWIGLAVVFASCLLFVNGGNLRWLAVLPPRWTSFPQVTADVAANWPRYGAQFLFWLAAFCVALYALGHKIRAIITAFALLYLAA